MSEVMKTNVKTWLLVALPVAILSRGTRADEPQGQPADPPDEAPTGARAEAPAECGADVHDTPPDPRCGDTLDGRGPPQAPGSKAGKAALFVPKEIALGAVWPVVKGADFIERHRLPGWYKSLLTSDDGLVGIRPDLNISTGLLPTIGAHFFYRRLPDEAEITARAVTAGPPVFFGMLEVASPAWLGLAATASYEHRTDRLFAGVGPNSESELAARGQAVSRYGGNVARGDLGWFRELPRHFRILAHGGILRSDYESDSVRSGPSVATTFGLPPADCMALGVASPCVNPAQMPGFYTGQRVIHAGGGFGIDTRNHLREGGGVSAVVDATGGWGVGNDQTHDVRFSGELIDGYDIYWDLHYQVSNVSAAAGQLAGEAHA